jgi:hypothetical protein
MDMDFSHSRLILSMILYDQDELYVRQQHYLAVDVFFCSQLQRRFEFHVKHGA